MKLVDPDHRKGGYNQPQRPYICGLSSQGRPCDRGPNHRGKCPGGSACQPIMKGYRFQCTRSKAFGGPCEDGPAPDGSCSHPNPTCTPEASQRLLRTRIIKTSLVASVLVCIGILGSGFGRTFMFPGKLISAHSALDQRCESCHSSAEQGLSAALLRASHSSVQDDSELCLNCHDKGHQPFYAHGLDPRVLAQMHPEYASNPNKSAQLYCASCHRDHRGRDFPSAQLDNAKCQACHSVKIDDFESDHPSFHDYPNDHPPAIVFDHVLHQNQHFPERETRFTCDSCHLETAAFNMSVESFDATCRDCHDGDIRGVNLAGEPGVLVWSAPGLDVETLEEAGLNVGDWPAYGDLELSPFQRHFLPPSAETDLLVWDQVDLLDLSAATTEQLQAVQRTALNLKRQLANVLHSGQAALVDKVHSTQIAHRLGGLSEVVLKDAIQQWFPDLLTEAALIDQSKPLPASQANRSTTSAPKTPAPADDDLLLDSDDLGDDLLGGDDLLSSDDLNTDDLFGSGDDSLGDDLFGDNSQQPETSSLPEVSGSAWSSYGGWYRRGDGLYYRPASHQDAFMRSWLDALANSPALNGNLMQAKGAGACAKCHSIAGAEGQKRIAWQPYLGKGGRGFTRFSHKPHLDDPRLDCITCHKVDSENDYLGSLALRGSSFEANFKPIPASTCQTCHQTDLVRDDCLTCHNYHANRFSLTSPTSNIPAPTTPAGP